MAQKGDIELPNESGTTDIRNYGDLGSSRIPTILTRKSGESDDDYDARVKRNQKTALDTMRSQRRKRSSARSRRTGR